MFRPKNAKLFLLCTSIFTLFDVARMLWWFQPTPREQSYGQLVIWGKNVDADHPMWLWSAIFTVVTLTVYAGLFTHRYVLAQSGMLLGAIGGFVYGGAIVLQASEGTGLWTMAFGQIPLVWLHLAFGWGLGVFRRQQ